MPWTRTDQMSERVKFIAAYLEYQVSFTDLCHDFGVSRKTGYKWLRRYEADGAVPASLFRPSLRAYPRLLPEPEYPASFETRVAYPNGVISFGTTQWYLSGCLAGERVGLEPCDDGRWRVHFAWVPIGLLDLKRATDRGARPFGMLEPIVDPALSRRRRRRYGS